MEKIESIVTMVGVVLIFAAALTLMSKMYSNRAHISRAVMVGLATVLFSGLATVTQSVNYTVVTIFSCLMLIIILTQWRDSIFEAEQNE